MPSTQLYNEDKFKELVLYVADRMSDDTTFGATKLNKVLFFADFFYYSETGKSITGAEYMKLQNGPAPRRMLPVQNELTGDGDAFVREEPVGTYLRKRLVPARDADVDKFSVPELHMVDQVIELLKGHTATAVSNASHNMVGWQLAGTKSTIPYNSVFLHTGPVSDDDEAKARELADLYL